MRFMNICLIFILLSILSNSLPARAISEKGYAQTMTDQVIPFLEKKIKNASFESFDGKKINYAIFAQKKDKGIIVISPGRTESTAGFSETIFDLYQLGFSIAIIDQRGQGYSERLVPSGDVGHVEYFSDYQKDFSIFMDLLLKETKGPRFLLASSMGTAVAIPYLVDHGDVFKAAVLAAPMIKINTAPYPENIARILASTLEFFGQKSAYAPGQGPYNYKPDVEKNLFTHSFSRYIYDTVITEKNPQIAVGGPSVRWVREALDVNDLLIQSSHKIEIPILILQAEKDFYVSNSQQRDFCQNAKSCQVKMYPDSYHWILMESDAVRNQIFKDVVNFLN